MRTVFIFNFLGGIFTAIGLISLFNVILGISIYHTVLWHGLAYACMDFLVAWGLFGRHSWLMPMLALNALGQLVLIVLRLFTDGVSSPVLSTLGVVLAWGLFLFAVAKRRQLSSRSTAYSVGALFLVLWVLTMGYTVYTRI